MTHLSLYLLGPFQTMLAGEPVKGFDSDKVRALLAYLAVEADRPHRRETLAGLLWPEQPEQTARSNLRYALSNLRRVIGDRSTEPPFLLITRHTLQFNPVGDSWLDVTAFTKKLTGLRDLSALETVTQLKQAVTLYRGDFLEGFSLVDSAPFEEWALFTRETLARQAGDTLRRLAGIYEQHGEYESAQRYARQQLKLEPWHEESHRQLMRLLAFSGQRSAALAQYQTCRQILAEELGVEPMPETTALYERIHDGSLSEGAGEQGSRDDVFALAPPLPSSPAPFVGREVELAKLDRFLETALAGQGRVVFVTGEAGRGKTALLAEFTRLAMARHHHLLVAGGSCNAYADIGVPYLPFREIIRMLTGDIEAKRAGGDVSREHAHRLWHALPTVAQTLVEVGPGLLDLFVPGETLALRLESFAAGSINQATWWQRLQTLINRQVSSVGEPTDIRQEDVFEQMTRMLQALARSYPLLLVLDDLQWIDSGSVSLLFHLGRRLTGSRILIVGAYRPEDVALGRLTLIGQTERHPLAPIINEFQRDFGDIHLDLGEAEGRHFVDALVDVEPNRLDRAFRDMLTQQTDGNPLFTVELLRGLQERGDLVRDETGQWVQGQTLDWSQLPTRVEAVIAERIERLLPEWQTILTTASIEGEVFTAEAVARVQGVDERTIIERLSGALNKKHRLVRPTSLRYMEPGGQRLSRYRFRHYLFQKYLYTRLDELERSHLHEAVGNTLESLYQAHRAEPEMGDIWLQLARHFEAAGLVSKAVAYLLRAGQRAARMSANEDAIALFSRGLALLETLPASPERAQQELDLQLALGGLLLTIQGWGVTERIQTCERAYELCLQIGGITQLLYTLFLQADVCRAQGKLQESVDLGEQLLNLTHSSQDPLQIALPHWTLGETHFFRGDLILGRKHLEQAIALYDPHKTHPLTALGGVDMKVSCLSWLSWILWVLGYPDQALGQSQEALTLAQELDHPFSLSFVLSFSSCGLRLFRREPQQTHQFLTTLEQIVAANDLVVTQAWTMVCRGWQQILQKQLQEGITQTQAGMAAWQAIGAVSGITVQAIPLIEGYGRSGQVEKGLNQITETLAMINETGERLVEAEIYRLKGELLLETKENEPQGDLPEDCFQHAIELARRQQAKSWELRATMSLARLWHSLRSQSQQAEARQMLVGIYGWFSEGFDTPDLQEAKVLLEELSPD